MIEFETYETTRCSSTLSHLEADAIDCLINHYYWRFPPLDSIKHASGIFETATNELSTYFPFAIDKGNACDVCTKEKVRQFLNRDYHDNNEKKRLGPAFCMHCDEQKLK